MAYVLITLTLLVSVFVLAKPDMVQATNNKAIYKFLFPIALLFTSLEKPGSCRQFSYSARPAPAAEATV